MRKKRVFIFIGFLVFSMLCVYTLVHTVPATFPVVQEGAEAPANDVPAEYLESLEEDVLVLEEVEKELNAEGTDPHTFFVAFRLEISDD